MSRNLVLIFIRNPELGKCKTRLAKTVGNTNALAIYNILLQHTISVTENLNTDKAVYYSAKITENDVWDDTIYQKFKQVGEDLGLRMLQAFKNSFQAGYERVVIIGSDLIDLKQSHIKEAFSALDTNNVVIGPAEDGGYYLLGMKELIISVFKNKIWGTPTVRKDTLSDLSNKKVALLETLNDIDVYDDIKDNNAIGAYLKIATEKKAILK